MHTAGCAYFKMLAYRHTGLPCQIVGYQYGDKENNGTILFCPQRLHIIEGRST